MTWTDPNAPARRPVLLLVPNNSARSLAEGQYCLERAGDGPLRAPRVDVLSLWAGKTLQRLQLLAGEAARPVPPRFVLAALWERVISERDGAEWSPGDISATAREAMEADRLLKHWIEGASPEAEDARPWLGTAFFRWRGMVRAAMDRGGWTDATSQLQALVQRLEDGRVAPAFLPAELRLRGFVERTALEQRLFDTLRSCGVTVADESMSKAEPRPGSRPSASPTTRLFRSIDDELRDAAAWANAEVDAGAVRLAVAVNGFDALREQALHAFSQRFETRTDVAPDAAQDAAFHVQGGLPLARHPAVRAMLDLLELSRVGPRRAQGFGLLSRWLLSGAWAGAMQEAPARARLELRLRRAGRAEASLADVAQAAEGLACPLLVERIARMTDLASEGNAARRFLAWLEHWGWPGPLAGGAEVQRAVDGVRRALYALDAAGLEESGAALAALRAQCQDGRIPGPGGSLSPVQLLDVRDLAGQRFEQVRIVNVHAENWPEPPRTNRLLPFALARRLPGGDSASQRRRIGALQAALLRSSGAITVSRAAQVDGVPTAPSAALPVVEEEGDATGARARHGGVLARAAWPGAGEVTALDRDRLSAMTRRAAPAVPPSDERLAGAVRLLNTQSACPWAAFLVHRLDARFPGWPSAFPDQAFTGNLVHEALRQLYRAHRSTGSLPTAAEVPAAVRNALRSEFADRVLSPAVVVAEERRLEALLSEWLSFEETLDWPSPLAVEAQREAELAGFRLGIRIDRVDRVGEGTLILDYKTGSPQAPDWSSDRLTDVQLPLYAVLLGKGKEAPLGIGLLTVRANGMAQTVWIGEAGVGGKGVTVMGDRRAAFPDWSAAVGHWRRTLTALLEEYRTGHVAFEVHHERALAFLGLEPLLRGDAGRIAEATDHG